MENISILNKKQAEDAKNRDFELEQSHKREAELKEAIELNEHLQDLIQQKSFKAVIDSAYFEKEAERLKEVLVTPSTLKRDIMENVIDKFNAIRNLKQFFIVIEQNAIMAPSQIEEEIQFRKDITKHYAEKDLEDDQ